MANQKIELVAGGQNVNGKFVPNAPKTTTSTNAIAPTTSPTITSTMLQPSPDFNLTPPKPATAMTGLGSSLELQADTFSKDLAAKASATEQNKDTALTQYLNSLLNTQGEVALTNEAYAQTVDPLEAELKDINQQMLEEQHSLRRRLEALDKNQQGYFGGALEQEKARVERESISKQADLSVIQLARQGRYDSAKAIADRAVAAKVEQQKTLNEALKFNYEENRNLFTVAEQRAFETAQGDRERKLDKEEADLKQISDLSLEALRDGAPASIAAQMRAAKTVEEAVRIGGQYVGRLDREAKQAAINASYASAAASKTNELISRAKLGDPKAIDELGFNPAEVEEEVDPTTKRQLSEAVSAQDSLLGLANQYKNLIDTYGFTNKHVGNSEVLGKISSLRALMTAEYKKAATLGTLDTGVLTLMEQIIGQEPTSGLNVTSNITGRKANKLSSQINTFIEQTTSNRARDLIRLGINPSEVEFSVLTQDDEAEISSYYGTQTSTSSGFNPAQYFNN